MNVRKVSLVCGMLFALVLLLVSCVPIQAPPPAADDAQPVVEEQAVPKDGLMSIPVDAAPTLDGVADEDFWADAPVLKVGVKGGANMSEGEVSLQSVYDQENVYMLITWTDPTESFIRSPWVKQDDGSWTKLQDPDDKGGDNNVYYEDKMAMIWTIDNSIPEFERKGCFTACHDNKEDKEFKPYGNKFTSEGMGDIWHWKSVRNLNQIDDQYLDSTQYSPDTPEAGRHSDPKDGGGYVDNQTEDKTMPQWMGPEGTPRDGSPGYILDAEKQPFDDTLFAAGDMLPGIVKSTITGDRGNISAGWKWQDGMWTLELGRPLVTSSEFDVQFNDLTQPYFFGIALFDNAQVRHSYHGKSETLMFQQ